MNDKLTLAQRLVVAADFKPDGSNVMNSIEHQVLSLADLLSETGVCLKVNSALRICGYRLIDEIHSRGLQVFADLKLNDIRETLLTDGILLRETNPELLTVVCSTGVAAMKALKAQLPDTEVLGVTVLTSLADGDTNGIYACSTEEAVMRLVKVAADAKINGLVLSPKEIDMVRERFGETLSFNTPAVRPKWAVVNGDDQNQARVMTPEMAIRAGARRIIVGRPITQAKNPNQATMRTIEEISLAV